MNEKMEMNLKYIEQQTNDSHASDMVGQIANAEALSLSVARRPGESYMHRPLLSLGSHHTLFLCSTALIEFRLLVDSTVR